MPYAMSAFANADGGIMLLRLSERLLHSGRDRAQSADCRHKTVEWQLPANKERLCGLANVLATQLNMNVLELVEQSGYLRSSVSNSLRKLQQDGKVEATGARNSPRRRYRLAKT